MGKMLFRAKVLDMESAQMPRRLPHSAIAASSPKILLKIRTIGFVISEGRAISAPRELRHLFSQPDSREVSQFQPLYRDV